MFDNNKLENKNKIEMKCETALGSVCGKTINNIKQFKCCD